MAEIDTFIGLAKKRRSIRKLKRDPIPEGAIEKIVEAARWAPSGANTQPWEFIVIKDQETKMRIAEFFSQSLEAKRLKNKSFPYGLPGKAEKLLEKKFTDAPVLFIVCSDPRFKAALPKDDAEELLYVSMGAVMAHIHLAVTALGLALAWGSVSEDIDLRLKVLMGIPSALRVLEVFTIGYANMDPIPRHCREVKELLHQEKFDQSKWRKDQEIKDMIAARKFPDVYSGV